ncbi:MAG: ATP-binding cassette domain-containing protein [Lachnospiraceae bacterium]|nr:ATP-binding cassette domain-containing protein [Clostridiales bacterium]MBR4009926.1 ATP-binding cassette domain-containing protein [Clostridiales bacterium]MBR6851839.1 ATP-binding cassette domain-containing protein [Lachnospiraceae bacterium]
MSLVLETNSLTKKYRGTIVVDHVSMRLEKGDIYGLIGRNGAGKTTIMRMLGGIARPTSGTYEFFGEKDNKKTIKRIGCLIESPSLYTDMSVVNNLKFYNKLLGITDNSNIEEILELVELTDAKKKTARKLSLGMKQRLGIAIALIGNPDILILDEPVNGLDPTGIVEIRNLLLKLNQERGVTILISSHILGELQRLATRYGIIDKGVLVEEISHEELLEKTRQAIQIDAQDAKAVAVVLEEMELRNYKILPDQKVQVFCDTSLSGNINATLASKGIYAESIRVVGQDLEAYFVEKMGGADHE